MLNQVPAEAVYSATYVENYLDCMENLPNDLQRLISRMRELDVNYLARVREAEIQTELWRSLGSDSAARKGKMFFRMQQALSAAQELGDEKMSLLQAILEKIEMKTRLLNQDHKNLDFGKEEPASVDSKETTLISKAAANSTPTTAAAVGNTNSSERPVKRPRRARNDTFTAPIDSNNTSASDVAAADHVLRSQAVTTTSAAANSTNTTTVANTNPSSATKKTNAGTGKKKKRKSRNQSQIVAKEETPPREEEPLIDPNEPTYCLCDQISFGEMIMCDNDLCPIEWFHFSCVSLSTKPKGKWYCPKCRGDRPNIMKPKQQFLRELERYNKEKEEKT